MKNNISFKNILVILVLLLNFALTACGKKGGSNNPTPPPPPPPPVATNDIEFWLTRGDQTVLLQKQNVTLSFGTTANAYSNVNIDTTNTYQTIDGFGYTLTGGSAYVINQLTPTAKSSLLNELFGNGNGSIGISYLRISIGASDLNSYVFTYDDMPPGQTDISLANFSLNPDKTDLIPLLKEILAINPAIKILGSPWTPPVWMKDNGSSIGGSLKPEYYSVYAQYFVKYIQQMKAEGITIDAITPQNEPLNPGNNPSLLMTSAQQADFIKNHLGPAFKNASISTKILLYDHNCDRPDYPMDILADATAKSFVSGSAFHLYAGNINALSTVHTAYPDKDVYFTEQWTGANGSFSGDLSWHIKNVVIGSMRNWSKTALEWNLANDASYGPHTTGGCTECKGALTISSTINRNVGYYIIAHASKFVPAGSVRIASDVVGNIQTVAFKTPAGKKVLVALNEGTTDASFNIRFNNKWAPVSLPAGSVGSFIF